MGGTVSPSFRIGQVGQMDEERENTERERDKVKRIFFGAELRSCVVARGDYRE